MRFGLEEKTIEKINQVLANHSQVDQVILFGSRAMGNFKNGSDIDLAIKGVELNLKITNEISDEIDDLLLPYSFDLINFSHINNSELLNHINRVGMTFYQSLEADN